MHARSVVFSDTVLARMPLWSDLDSPVRSRADVTYDLQYASVLLKTSDGQEFRASQGLCAGSCSTLRTLFEVDPQQRVFTIPSEVSAGSLGALLKWLHGPRSGINMNLDHEQAAPIMHAADYLGMQCWLDNCASQMNLRKDWLAWVELADAYTCADLLTAVLNKISPYDDISAPDICDKISSIPLIQIALQHFDEVSACYLLYMHHHYRLVSSSATCIRASSQLWNDSCWCTRNGAAFLMSWHCTVLYGHTAQGSMALCQSSL